jgi:hypothetical protein
VVRQGDLSVCPHRRIKRRDTTATSSFVLDGNYRFDPVGSQGCDIFLILQSSGRAWPGFCTIPTCEDDTNGVRRCRMCVLYSPWSQWSNRSSFPHIHCQVSMKVLPWKMTPIIRLEQALLTRQLIQRRGWNAASPNRSIAATRIILLLLLILKGRNNCKSPHTRRHRNWPKGQYERCVIWHWTKPWNCKRHCDTGTHGGNVHS